MHDSVLDAVVDHLDVVPCAARPKVSAAGAVFGLSGHLGEHGFQVPVRLFASSRHKRRPVERAFFAAAHSHAKEAQAAGFQVLRAPLRIFEIRIAAIYKNVIGAEVGVDVV